MNQNKSPLDCDSEAEFRNPIEALGEDLLYRRRKGENVTIGEYVNEYPEFADQIRQQFPIMIALEKFKESALSSPSDSYDLQINGPAELGDFNIIREIGRGAMGVVYEAEQQSLQRRVAVKVFPRQALREARKLERFARESKMAARLHHNNIVPVFGVGQHDGLHYFVMQRIKGIGLDEIIYRAKSAGVTCRPGRSGLRDETIDQLRHPDSTAASGAARSIDMEGNVSWVRRKLRSDEQACDTAADDHVDLVWDAFNPQRSARIGIQVADAVHYAHSQGVLHRDIKPSNLMIDADGTVWVTDFGLATALQEEQPVDRSDIAGTLRFMAPEQLSGKHDTRSDIYSLGVTLYELLTLQPAFVADSKAAVVDRILKGEFERPRKIQSRVPRDLEAIVLKAMALQPEHRYQSGRELADDLQRFVDGRPVHARRIGVLGRSMRWIRRDPLAASLVGALGLVICTSFVLVSTKWHEAVSERQRAESNLELALESMDQILGRFTSSWMARPTDRELGSTAETPSVELQMVVSDHSASLMEDALAFYDRFAAENAPTPRLLRDTARVHQRAGEIYQRLGQFAKAEHAYARCLEILEQQDATDDPTTILSKATTLNQLGLTKHATSRFADAVNVFSRARAILSAPALSRDPECQAELARTYSNLGQSQWMMMQHQRAKQSHRKAVGILECLVDLRPEDPSYQLALARAYRAYYPLASDGKNDEKDRVRSAGIAILEELVAAHPEVPDYQCALSEMLTATSHRFRRRDNSELHLAQIQRGIDLSRELTKSYPSITRYEVVLALALKTMAETLDHSNPNEAISYMGEAIDLYRSLTRSFPDVPTYHILCAMAHREQALNYRRTDQFAQSKTSAEAGITELKIYNQLRPHNPFAVGMLAQLYDEVALASDAINDKGQADAARKEAEQLRRFWNRNHAG
ncbi:MAG: serine/threonine protein kinase [Planctomycetales bacterium]|nr:serine/threonine protein kinase [Planctomycetales bacterium]